MATLPSNVLDPNEQNPTGGPTTISGTAGAGSGGTGGGSGAAAPASNVQQNAAAQNQSGYTDVGAYLNANQAGSQKLGQSVASNLTNKYNETKGGIDTSAGATNAAIGAGYTPTNTDLIKQVAADPTKAAADPNQLSAFQSQLNDVYGGPMGWGDLGAQQGKVNEANQYGALNTTPGGVNVLTQGVEGANASQGVNQLDTMLLQGNAGAMGAVKTAADPYKTLNDYLNTQNTGINNAVTTGQTNAANASQGALDAFTGANGTLTNLNSQIGQETTAAQAAQDKSQADIAANFAGLYTQPVDTKATSLGTYGGGSTPWANTTNYTAGSLTPQTLAALGLTAEQGQALQQQMQAAGTSQYMTGHNFGAGSGTSQIDINQYLAQNSPQLQAGTVANKDEYAKMGAIQQLLGDKNPQGNAINPDMAALSGITPSAGELNQFDYQSALANATGAATGQRTDAQNMANELTSGADAAHAASQHGGGVLGALKRDAMNPLKLSETLANPLGYAANTERILKGKDVNPKDISHPHAKVIAPAIGAIIGGIYGGGYPGAVAGAAAGNAVGGPMETMGGQANKAHGGEILPPNDIEKYLNKRKK